MKEGVKEGVRLLSFLNKEDEADHTQCLAEGYSDEVCQCGRLFAANCHFVMCCLEACPMQSSDSVLDILLGPDEEVS